MKSDAEVWAALERRLLNPDPDAYAPPPLYQVLARPDEFEPVAPTAADRAEYDYDLTERAGLLLDSGLTQADADAAALAEVGRFELWLYVRQVNAWADARGAGPCVPTSRQQESVFCSRCESVGHLVEACPFWLTDEAVTKVARLRRESRAGREAVA